MKNLPLLLCLFFISGNALAQNQPPVISNVFPNIDYANNTITIDFDVVDNENDDVEITLQISDNDGQTYTVNTSNTTGDVGYPITSGTGKQLVWIAPNLNVDYKLRVVADDLYLIDIQELVDQVDITRLWDDLTALEGIRHRITGNVLLENTRTMLQQNFENNGLDTYNHEFDFNGYTGKNIIGDLRGIGDLENVFILDGHYDTVDDSPGADDNATAVAGVMEAVRILSPHQFKKTIRFIGFDLEEEGLQGSSAYVPSGIPSYENIEGVLNLEMIGYYDDTPNSQLFPAAFATIFPDAQAILEADSFRGNFITNVSLEPQTSVSDAFHLAANTYVPDLKVIDIINPTGFLIPDLFRSDHAPFWAFNIPAVMLTDGADFRNPNYHTLDDTKEELDQTFFSNVVKAAIATIAELAEIRNVTFTTVDIISSTNDLDCNFRIYPNPVDEFVQLSFGECISGELNVQLFDLTGFLFLEKNIFPNLNDNITINTHPLPSGIYFLKIGNEGNFSTKKIIVY